MRETPITWVPSLARMEVLSYRCVDLAETLGGKFDEDNEAGCGEWTNHFGDMEESYKSPIIWPRCLPCQTLSTTRGIAHTNSVPNVKSSINRHRKLLFLQLFILFFFLSCLQRLQLGNLFFFSLNTNVKKSVVFAGSEHFWQIKTGPCQHANSVVKLMKSSGTHSWVSLGSWKAFTGIWLMRFRLSLRTCRVEPRWFRAPSSNTLILLLLRYLKTERAHWDIRDL